MVVRLHRAHPRNEQGIRSYAVTPWQVAVFIRGGLAAGWRPTEPGPQFNFDPRVDPNIEALRIDPVRSRGRAALLSAVRARADERDALRLDFSRADQRSTRRPCWLSGLEINGRDLIEWIYDVERPLVDEELAADDGEAPDRGEDFAGQYLGLGESVYRLPSRALLGEVPSWEASVAFQTAPDDPRRRKTTLLDCTCGISECWFLLATITVLDDVVIWSDFEQFHRAWVYDLGPFVFDREAYLASIAPSAT